MPKRSRLYNVAGLTNRQRRNILEQQQQAPGLNEVEDLQKAYGRLFNQVNKYISQLQNISNIGRGLSRRINDIRKIDGAYRRAGAGAGLYLRTAGRTVNALKAFARENRNTISSLRSTARASAEPVKAMRSFGRSLSNLRGNERPLRAVLKVLQQSSTVFSRTARNSDQTRASFDLLGNTVKRFRTSVSQVNKDAKEANDGIFLLRGALERVGRTDFGRQFGATFRRGHAAIAQADTNSKRLATTLGLVVRPLGIINNEYRRLSRGRHRSLSVEFRNVYDLSLIHI